MPSGSHDIDVKLLSVLGIVGSILVVALVVATQAWFRYEFQQENERKYINIPYGELVELDEAQLAGLHAPTHVVESEDGVTRTVIPIDEAIDRVIAEHGTEQ